MDDIPVALFDTRAKALSYCANEFDPSNWDHINPPYYDTDASTPISLAIVHFHCWKPQSIEVVVSFGDYNETSR
jgi:hypothetical protein